MTSEQITKSIMDLQKEVAASDEKIASAHKRLNEIGEITKSIYKMSASVQALAVQIKSLADKMDDSVSKLQAGLKNQDERIGVLEKEPGDKWKKLIAQIITLAVAAVMGAIMAKFF